MIREKSFTSKLFDILNYGMLILIALVCLLPVVHMVAVSFSDRASITAGLVTIFPKNVTWANYDRILGNPQFRHSFLISILRLVLGTLSQVLFAVLTAYPLAQEKGFRGQGIYKGVLILSMILNAGLIPWFLVLRALGLTDNFMGLILPGILNIWNVIIMINFFREIPAELQEAAMIDGATHWDILFRIYLPISLPALAVVTLYSAVGHWNAWFDGLVLMNTADKYPLQTLLQTMVVQKSFLHLLPPESLIHLVSERGMRAAMIIVTIIPIVLVYPLLQRYFIKGLRLGSVKG